MAAPHDTDHIVLIASVYLPLLHSYGLGGLIDSSRVVLVCQLGYAVLMCAYLITNVAVSTWLGLARKDVPPVSACPTGACRSTILLAVSAIGKSASLRHLA